MKTYSAKTSVSHRRNLAYRRLAFSRGIEFVIAAMAILCIAGAVDGVFRVVSQPDAFGRLESYSDLYVFFRRAIPIFAAIVAARDVKATVSLLLKAWPLTVSLAWIIASSVWSLDPWRTMVRSISLISVIVLAAGLISRYGVGGIIKPVRYAGVLLLVVNLVLLINPPSFAIDELEYGKVFQGTFAQKNLLALFFTCLVICLLAELSTEKNAFKLAGNIGLIGGSAFLVAESQSATGLLILIGALFIAGFMLSLRHSGPSVKLVGLISAALLAVTVGIGLREEILHGLGRDFTFTGRTTLWELLLVSIRDRPVLGFGYDSYWGAQGGADYYLANWWIAAHSHNGFLDALINGGAVLLGLVVIQTFVLLVRAGRLVAAPDSTTNWFIVLVATLLPIYNLVEPVYLRSSVSTFLFAVAVFAAVSKRSINEHVNNGGALLIRDLGQHKFLSNNIR